MNPLHYLEYYIRENPNYGKPKGEFFPPTKEDFEYIQGFVEPHNQIKTYEEYVKRMKAEHEKPELEFQLNKVAIERDNESEQMAEVEKSEGFVRWID